MQFDVLRRQQLRFWVILQVYVIDWRYSLQFKIPTQLVPSLARERWLRTTVGDIEGLAARDLGMQGEPDGLTSNVVGRHFGEKHIVGRWEAWEWDVRPGALDESHCGEIGTPVGCDGERATFRRKVNLQTQATVRNVERHMKA